MPYGSFGESSVLRSNKRTSKRLPDPYPNDLAFPNGLSHAKIECIQRVVGSSF